jgi:hypothetical protein
MSKTKTCAAIAGGLLLFYLGACDQLTGGADRVTAVPATSGTSGGPDPSISLAPSSSTPTSLRSDAATPAATRQTNASAAPPARTVRVTTATKPTAAKPTPRATTKPATTPTAAPTFRYTPPSTAGILTLTCTWDGNNVDALAQWSGAVEIVLTVSAPGLTYTSPTPSSGVRVHGLAGQHGACVASGGGQTKSASA